MATMKLDNKYNSRIGNLFPNHMDNYFFISDWDLHNPQFLYDTKVLMIITLQMNVSKKNYG